MDKRRDPSIYSLEKPFEDVETLIFSSDFECGNLDCAYLQEGTDETIIYNLIPQADYNSRGINDWFYFQVDNLRPNKKYSFIICLNGNGSISDTNRLEDRLPWIARPGSQQNIANRVVREVKEWVYELESGRR